MVKDVKIELLIDGCLKRDQTSQLRLYEHFFGYGMGVCLRYSKNREEALEIVNDGFLKVFAKIEQYDVNQPFKPWLRRILINVSIDYYRKYNKHKESTDVSHEYMEQRVSYNDALDNLAFDDLIKIIQKLTPAYKMVFNLYVVENFSHQEIAEKLQISIGTSKSNLAKARKKVNTMLADYYGIYLKPVKNGE